MKTFLKLPYASTGKLIAIGKYFELISRNFRITDVSTSFRMQFYTF